MKICLSIEAPRFFSLDWEEMKEVDETQIRVRGM